MVRRSPTNLKHRNVDYCSDAQASRKVNTHLFRKLENITEDTYEVESCKKSVKLNLPIQVGFFFVPVCQTSHATVLL